jgi:hypothetical protein
MLQRFLLDDRLPPAILAGTLADLGYPIPYTCALPPPEDRLSGSSLERRRKVIRCLDVLDLQRQAQ